MAIVTLQRDFPDDGFDPNWDLSESQLPRPSWMLDDRQSDNKSVYDVAEDTDNLLEGTTKPQWQNWPEGPRLYFNKNHGRITLPSVTIGNGVAGTYAWWARTVYSGFSMFIGTYNIGNDYVSCDHGYGFQMAAGASYHNWAGETDFQNRWRHFALVADGSGYTPYIDGIAQARWATPGELDVDCFGAPFNNATYHFNGTMSRLVYWDSALSDLEVHLLYESQLSGGPGVLGESIRKYYPVSSGGGSSVPYWILRSRSQIIGGGVA